MKKACIWLYLLTKRLLKKPIFLVTLALIPILTFAVAHFPQENGSIVRVALYTMEHDEIAEQTIARLLQNDGIMHFEYYDDEAAAIEAVMTGKADSAWGFCEDFTKNLRTYARTMKIREPLIYIHEQQENLHLRLAREHLYAALIPSLSREIYKEYLAKEFDFDIAANEDALDQIYEENKLTYDIMHFEFVDHEISLASLNYLSMPLRGLVAVLMMICGIAAAMMFLRERENGVYSYLSARKQFLVLIGSCFAALTLCGAVALLAMALSGNFTSIGRELLLMLLYILMCTFTCVFLAQICQKATALAIILPVEVILLLVFCPIFLNHKIGMPLPYFLPTYYYLHAVTADRFIPMMLLFIAVSALICVIAEELSRIAPKRFFFRHA